MRQLPHTCKRLSRRFATSTTWVVTENLKFSSLSRKGPKPTCVICKPPAERIFFRLSNVPSPKISTVSNGEHIASTCLRQPVMNRINFAPEFSVSAVPSHRKAPENIEVHLDSPVIFGTSNSDGRLSVIMLFH